jgi:hypothetical protein
VRRAALGLVAVLVALAAVAGLVAVLQSRDEPGIDSAAPGAPAPDADGRRLRLGNVVLSYRSPRDAAPLRALADELAGPADPALVAAGQAVIVERAPRQAEPVVAEAFRRRQTATRGDDPAVRVFAEYWLGRAGLE